MYKKVLSVILCVILALVSSCGNNNSTSEKDAEISRLQEMVDSLSSTSDTDVSLSEAVTTSSVTIENEASTTTTLKAADDTTSRVSFDSILLEINDDFDTVISNMENKLNSVYSTIGDTYEGYVANESALDSWYRELYQESENLYKRTIEKNIEYYKLIADSSERGDYKFTDSLLDNLYDAVYKDAFSNYYDRIYKGVYGEIYDKYYKGIIRDARKSVDYSDWSNTSSDCYKKWSDSKSEIYSLWSDKKSFVYSLRSEISSGFLYNDNFDVDAIVDEVKSRENNQYETSNDNNVETTTEMTAEISTTTEETTVEPSSNELRSDFKEAMDSYEAFFSGYCDFMKKYKQNPSDLNLLTEYLNWLTKYTETMDKMNAWESKDLNDAEMKYYLEVSGRINKMLIESSLS